MSETMGIEELVEEFAQRRTDASDSGAETTGLSYAKDIYPPATYTDGGSGKHGQRAVKAWIPWMRERERDIWEADTGDVRRYLRDLDRADYAQDSVGNRLKATSLFYQEIYKMHDEGGYALPADLIQAIESADDREAFNPARGIDRSDFGLTGSATTKKQEGLSGRNEVSYLSNDELDLLEENAGAPKTRNQLIIRLLWTTGLRRKELALLELTDVDEDKQILTVPPVKGNEGRRVPYPDIVEPLLSDWLINYRDGTYQADESSYLFPTPKLEHITGGRVNTIVTEAAEKAGIQEKLGEYADGRSVNRLTAHALRHTFGVKSVKSDMDIRTLQKIMGHEDIQTTERYLQLAEDDLMDRARQFDPNA